MTKQQINKVIELLKNARMDADNAAQLHAGDDRDRANFKLGYLQEVVARATEMLQYPRIDNTTDGEPLQCMPRVGERWLMATSGHYVDVTEMTCISVKGAEVTFKISDRNRLQVANIRTGTSWKVGPGPNDYLTTYYERIA